MKQGRGKNIIFSCLLLCGSLSLSALAGEAILRFLGHHGAPRSNMRNIYRVDDQMVDWRYMPNSEIKEGRVIYKYNSRGFRDVEHAIEKPPGTTRIVVVGDSVTQGYGVEWKSIFSRSIQSKLDDESEVITIAAGGLNTPQEIHLFEEEGLPYDPDLVVLNFVLNDCDFFTNFEGSERYQMEKDSRVGLLNVPIDPRLKRLLKSSAFVYFVKERVEDLKGRILGIDNTDYFTSVWSQEANRRKVTNAFDKLIALQRDHDFKVLVIVWPVITDYNDYRFEHIHRWVAGQAKKRGFSFIDLFPNFSKIPYRDLQITSEDNVHPNAVGHRIAAESFLTWYRSRDNAG